MEHQKIVPQGDWLDTHVARVMRALDGLPTCDELAAAAAVIDRLANHGDTEASERRKLEDAMAVLRAALEGRDE